MDYIIIYFNKYIDCLKVGDALVPLFRTVSVSGGKVMVMRTFNNKQYVELHRKQFNTVNVLTIDDTGSVVPFQREKTVLTVHLKQQKSAYFESRNDEGHILL